MLKVAKWTGCSGTYLLKRGNIYLQPSSHIFFLFDKKMWLWPFCNSSCCKLTKSLHVTSWVKVFKRVHKSFVSSNYLSWWGCKNPVSNRPWVQVCVGWKVNGKYFDGLCKLYFFSCLVKKNSCMEPMSRNCFCHLSKLLMCEVNVGGTSLRSLLQNISNMSILKHLISILL